MAKQETRGYIGTYRKPGTAAVVYNPGATILEGIEKAGEAITGRIKTVRDFENAAAIRRQETLNSLAETEGMKDFTALDSLQQQLMSEIDELYRLDIASFEGDRSAYLKKKNEMQRVIGDIPALMGLIDQEAELLKETEQGGEFAKKFLQSNNEDYYNFVSNASKGGDKVSFRIQNGNIIAQLDGKDVFNGHAYINAKKDGYDLVEYAGEYDKEINAADAQAYKGLDKLVTSEIIQKRKNYTTLSETEKKDYNLAKQTYRERLESGQIALPVNESTYQTFTNYATDVDTDGAKMDKWGKDIEIQSAATREAIIDYMVNQRFPEDVVTTKYKETYQTPPAVDTKTTPPTLLDPKIQNKINVNRAMVAALHGGEEKFPYRYDGKLMTSGRLASRLNDAVPGTGVRFVSAKERYDNKNYFSDDASYEKFKENYDKNPLFRKNIYKYTEGSGFSDVPFIDGGMSIDAMNQRVDEVFKINIEGYTIPTFEARRLRGFNLPKFAFKGQKAKTLKVHLLEAAEKHGPDSKQVNNLLNKLKIENIPPKTIKDPKNPNKQIENPEWTDIEDFLYAYNARPNTKDLPITDEGLLQAMKIMNKDYLTNTLAF